jgi:hypothetical protein
MKSLQNKIVDDWKKAGIDIVDTSKMHRMSESAINTFMNDNREGQWNLSWWATGLFVIIGTVTTLLLLYIAINPNFE